MRESNTVKTLYMDTLGTPNTYLYKPEYPYSQESHDRSHDRLHDFIDIYYILF
jgi:hypothetical protein